MYGAEETFRNTTERALYRNAVMCVTGLTIGVLSSNAACGMDLSEWNLVNGALCGAMAASANFALRVAPRAMQMGHRVAKGDITKHELMSEGLSLGAVAVGLVAIPLLLLGWSIYGLTGMGIGICSEASPLFFAATFCQMIVQGAAITYGAYLNLQAAGYDLDRMKQIAVQFVMRAKDLAVDICTNGPTYAVNLIQAVLTIPQWTLHKGRELWDTRPKYMTASYWTGPEGQALLS